MLINLGVHIQASGWPEFTHNKHGPLITRNSVPLDSDRNGTRGITTTWCIVLIFDLQNIIIVSLLQHR